MFEHEFLYEIKKPHQIHNLSMVGVMHFKCTFGEESEADSFNLKES
jgi:hypothetical protein